MPFEVAWYIEKRVIKFHLYGDLTLADFNEVVSPVYAMIEAGDPPVHIISDEHDVGKLPTLDLKEFVAALPYMSHPKLGWITPYSRILTPIAGLLTHYLTHHYQVRYRRFPSEEEAVAYLKAIDTTLDFSTVKNKDG